MYTLHINKDNVKDMVKYVAISKELVQEIVTLEDLNRLNIYEFNLLIGIYGLLANGLDDVSLTANGVCALIKPNNTTIITKAIAEATAKSLIEKVMLNCKFKQMFDVFMVEYSDGRKKEFDGMRIKIWREYQSLFGADKKEGNYVLMKFNEIKSINSVYAKSLYIILSFWRSIGKARASERVIMNAFGDTDMHKTRQSVRRCLPSLAKFFKGLSFSIETKKRNDMIDVYDEDNSPVAFYIFRFQKNINFGWKKWKSERDESEKVSD